MESAKTLIDNLREDNFSIEKGTAKAILPEERDKPYYKWAETGAIDYDTALTERIQRPLDNGMLIVRKKDGSVKFDDRKL